MDELKINEEFAKKYDNYRKAEELQKLKDKYGDVDDDKEDEESSSSSESEDETAEAINAKLEKDFFHTLACIKRKDPALYKRDEAFFDDPSTSDSDKSNDKPSAPSSTGKSSTKKPFLLKDYERKVAIERAGIAEPEESDDEYATRGSYYADLKEIKKSFSEAVKQHDDDRDDEDLLMKKKPSTSDANIETKLEELDEYWKDTNLNAKEKYLRDYILNRQYLEPDSEVESDENVEEIENDLKEEAFTEEQETFEHKFNTRYEDTDHAFIKRYPRTIANSVRRKDDRKKKSRERRKERKEEEKRKKIEELKRLKQLKREEIMDKIERLRVASGNTDLEFSNHDLNDEFDPADHDKRMEELFNSEFYAEEEDEKPHFSDIGEDEFGEDTNWDDYTYSDHAHYDEDLPDCEQPDFVMDCDYEPSIPKEKKNKKTSKKEKKKSKLDFYEAVSKHKPTSDEKSMSEHLEEYYAMDFDDLIGDMPCRFKYRTVPANDYGLTTEDILLADNATLNSWCSLKQVVRRADPEEEKALRRKYAKKARSKKEQCFGRFYADLEEKEKKSSERSEKLEGEEVISPKRKKKLNSKQRRRKRDREKQLEILGINVKQDGSVKKKNKKYKPRSEMFEKLAKLNTSRLKAYGLKPQKILNKAKYGLNSDKVKT